MVKENYLVRTFGTIILASASPRRAQILQQVGFDFRVVPSHLEEEHFMGHPIEIAKQLAEQKARSVALRYPGQITLGADTIVVLDGEILGKPRDKNEAATMLSKLSGRTHEVYTAYSFQQPENGRSVTDYACTYVTFHPLKDNEIKRYVESGSPMDKAGAYGIQDSSAVFVEKIDGDFYNVVGLPIAACYRTLWEHFTGRTNKPEGQ